MVKDERCGNIESLRNVGRQVDHPHERRESLAQLRPGHHFHLVIGVDLSSVADVRALCGTTAVRTLTHLAAFVKEERRDLYRVPHDRLVTDTFAEWHPVHARFRGSSRYETQSSPSRVHRLHGRWSVHAVLAVRQWRQAWSTLRSVAFPGAAPSSLAPRGVPRFPTSRGFPSVYLLGARVCSPHLVRYAFSGRAARGGAGRYSPH